VDLCRCCSPVSGSCVLVVWYLLLWVQNPRYALSRLLRVTYLGSWCILDAQRLTKVSLRAVASPVSSFAACMAERAWYGPSKLLRSHLCVFVRTVISRMRISIVRCVASVLCMVSCSLSVCSFVLRGSICLGVVGS